MELPIDFKMRMERQLGESYAAFLSCFEKGRVFGLRWNPLKIEKGRLLALLQKQGIPLEAVGWAQEGFYYPADTQPGKLPLHEAGAYYIQEPSAMSAVGLLDPQPGEKVLDLCAAPGGKSTQIAGRMHGSGLLVSNETVTARVKILSRNIERMGVRNAVVCNETPERLAQRFPVFFDRILVDAPCSGEGMFRKDENARKEWSMAQVEACADRQRSILEQAAGMLKPGGVLVYSTCTFAPQENEEMAAWFVKKFPQFSLEKTMQIWPHLQRGEGHYAARFLSKGVWGPQAIGHSKVRAPYALAGGGEVSHNSCCAAMQLLSDFCKDILSEEMAAWVGGEIQMGALALFGGRVYLMPPGIGCLDGLKIERAGLQLGCFKKNRFEPSHALAMALHPQDVKQALALDRSACLQYLRGETVNCGTQTGWTLAAVDGCSIGWGKASRGVLKNHYPKGIRRQGNY